MKSKTLRQILPYTAIFLSLVIYMEYWAEVVRQCPDFCNRGYDDFAYYADFLDLLKGTWPGNTIFFQSPLPGFFLGLIYIIFQHSVKNLAIPYLIQIFLLTLTCALTYKIARSLFSKYVGLIAVLFLGFYEFTKFYATTIEANILITFCLTATLYCLFNYRKHQNKRYLILASLCLGFATLGRTNNLVIIGAVIGWFIFLKISVKDLLIKVAVLGSLTLLVMSPAILHSSLNAGRLVLITGTGVYNFTMGNLPGAPGVYWDQATASLEPSLKFITQQPLDWLGLTLRKVRLFFTFPWTPTKFDQLPIYWWILWPIFMGLFLFYFFQTFSPARSLLHFSLIFYAASIIITHVEDEYRVPVLPIIFMFISVALVGLYRHVYTAGLKLYNKIISYHVQKPALIFIWSLFVLIIFGVQIPGPQTSHRVDNIESEAAYNGVIVGQRFQSECPKLYQIKVKMFSPNPDGLLSFHLIKEGAPENSEINHQEIPTAQLNSFDYQSIVFPEIPDSAGKQYAFTFDTAGLKSADEGIFFAGGMAPFAESLNRVYPEKRIAAGAFVNHGSLKGNLAFEAICHASLLDLIETPINQLAQQISPSPWIKPGLIAVISAHCLTLLGSAVYLIARFKLSDSARPVPFG